MIRALVPPDGWKPCLGGELVLLSKNLKARRRDRAVAKVMGAAGAVFLVAAAVGLIAIQLGSPRNSHLGNLSCADVTSNLRDYASGRLDEQLAQRIGSHLADCPSCAATYLDLPVDPATNQGTLKLGRLLGVLARSAGKGRDVEPSSSRNRRYVWTES